jgi:protein-tyrosine phosphatase
MRVQNLSWLSECLAVGGRVPHEAWPRFLSEHGIDSVVDLRSEEQDDAAWLAQHGLALLTLPTDDHAAIRELDLATGVAWVGQRIAQGSRVYVHCEHGIGRSVLLCWCVLVAQGTRPEVALRRIKAARAIASPSPAQIHALLSFAAQHFDTVPTWDELAEIAYAHLRASP